MATAPRTLLTVGLALLLVTACTNDSNDDAGSAATTTVAPTSTVAPTTTTTIPPTTTTTIPPTTTTTTIPPTTTTTIPLITAGAIVLIANAAAVPGAAGRLTAALQSVGYAMKEPTDAAGYESSLDATKIYFLPAAEEAARSLAAIMQVNSVSRMPTPAPIIDAQVGLGDATILLMLGKDLADQTIPGLAGR